MLTQPGVNYVIVLEGINDSSTVVYQAERIIAGLNQIIERAHEQRAHDLRGHSDPRGATGGTGAAEYTGAKPPGCQRRGSAPAATFDAVIDFDAVTRDPSNPTFFLPIYDSGDHLHPNDLGYQVMGNAIDLTAVHERRRPLISDARGEQAERLRSPRVLG